MEGGAEICRVGRWPGKPGQQRGPDDDHPEAAAQPGSGQPAPGQQHAGRRRGPAPPQIDGPDANQHADGRGQRDGVVGVNDACPKLSTAAVTRSQPPHSSAEARSRSLRGARRLHHSRAADSSSTAGSSHTI